MTKAGYDKTMRHYARVEMMKGCLPNAGTVSVNAGLVDVIVKLPQNLRVSLVSWQGGRMKFGVGMFSQKLNVLRPFVPGTSR